MSKTLESIQNRARELARSGQFVGWRAIASNCASSRRQQPGSGGRVIADEDPRSQASKFPKLDLNSFQARAEKLQTKPNRKGEFRINQRLL